MALPQYNGNTDYVRQLSDYVQGDAESVKYAMDRFGEEFVQWFNTTFLAGLASTTNGNSGADNIGVKPLTTGKNTVQATLEWLLTQIQASALGQIPDGTITDAKLSDTAGQVKSKVTTLESTVNALNDDYATHKADYEYQTPAIVGTQIQLTKQSGTDRLFFKLDADLSGGEITISLDAGSTSKPLVDVDGVAVTEIEKGFVEIIEEESFFVLRPRGAKLDEIIAAIEGKGGTIEEPKKVPEIVAAIEDVRNWTNTGLKKWAGGTKILYGTGTWTETLDFDIKYLIIKADVPLAPSGFSIAMLFDITEKTDKYFSASGGTPMQTHSFTGSNYITDNEFSYSYNVDPGGQVFRWLAYG